MSIMRVMASQEGPTLVDRSFMDAPAKRSAQSDLATVQQAAELQAKVSWFHRNRTVALLGAEITVALAAMVAVAMLTGATTTVLVLVAASSLAVRYYAGAQVLRPGLPRLESVVRDTSIPFCIAAVPVATGYWNAGQLTEAALIAIAGGAVALVAALLRHWIPSAERVVVVGSAVDIAESLTRWADSAHVEVVGSMIIESHDDLDLAPRAEVAQRSDSDLPHIPRQRVPEAAGAVTTLEHAAELDRDTLLRSRPDLVVVVQSPDVDAERIRRIGWALEGTGVRLAVQSELDGIAPHRLECTSYAGVSLMHIASSRPARLQILAKSVMDKLVGSLLLLLASPLLVALVVTVRATSDGPGMFRQVRVGANGRHFTMYKLRTMVVTAETDKAALADQNEGAGVLFKMQADPRITGVGRILRKFSLDELPQLINVVKGDMSLVGPRPALPEEVAQYTSLEGRRLAVKPGITGLWQVSGRSDLAWDESVRLDNHYTENWRMADDALIMVRTVDAVLRSRGAY